MLYVLQATPDSLPPEIGWPLAAVFAGLFAGQLIAQHRKNRNIRIHLRRRWEQKELRFTETDENGVERPLSEEELVNRKIISKENRE